MFPSTGANTSSGRGNNGQSEFAGKAGDCGSSGAPNPACRESSKKRRTVPAAAEGDGEEDEEEAAEVATAAGLSLSMLAAGLLLAACLFYLGQHQPPPEREGEASEVGRQPYVALLLLRLFLYLVCAAGAFFLGILLALGCQSRGRLLRPPDFLASWNRCSLGRTAAATLLQPAANLLPGNAHESVQSRRVMISHNMDKALKEVFDYIYRDYILSWYGCLTRDEGQLYHLLSEDFWEVAKQLRQRLSQIDIVKIICSDVVKAVLNHFCDLKAANCRLEEQPQPFLLHPYLRNSEEEARFLQAYSQILVYCLLPSKDIQSLSLCIVLSDVLATKVLKPMVDLLSDPNYINQILLAQMEYKEQINEHHKRAYTYAPSYEEFIKLISCNSDIEFLKQLRYQIVLEIVQATTISSFPQLKKQKENKGRETSAMKADHLRARNMKRYINQLTVAKKQCEKRIRLLGGPAYDQSEDIFEDSDGPQNQKILQFEDILCNPSYREYFQIYMERMDKKVLVSFWESVEYLKNANKAEIPQLVSQIYQDFFVESREISVEKSLYKDIQQSLVGNRGIDVFYKIQTHVYETLKDRYYPSFIVSDLYERLIKKEEERNPFQMTADDKEEVMQTCEEVIDEGSSRINEQASYAVNKLRQLNDKLEYKRQALNSLCSSPKPDKKIVSKLKDEIILMEREHSDLQLHIERTDLWCENFGMWKVFVNTGEDKEKFAFTIPNYNNMYLNQRYQWTVLPQGMLNSPTICQLYVHQALKPLRTQFPSMIIYHYMDDILCAAPQIPNNFLDTAANILKQAGLHLAPDKAPCGFRLVWSDQLMAWHQNLQNLIPEFNLSFQQTAR